jgi:molecular chaperone DnaK (HSP70)
MSTDTEMQEHKENNFVQDTKFIVNNNNAKQRYREAVKQVLKQLSNFIRDSKFLVNNNAKQHYQEAVKQVPKQLNNFIQDTKFTVNNNNAKQHYQKCCKTSAKTIQRQQHNKRKIRMDI